MDTNIIFAGLYSASGASFQVLRALVAERIQPVLSVALLFEYEEVLKRNRREIGLDDADIDAFLDNVCRLSAFHQIHFLWRPFLPDPRDDHVLELAVASQVRKIVTFNVRDFRGADMFDVAILSPKQVLEAIQWEH